MTEHSSIIVHPEQIIGPMKPVNGVNNGPLCLDGIFDFSICFQKAKFADVRTHDANYPARNVCDINAVFPRADADPCDPASYDFARTDHYLKSIRATGGTITYRLGYTIDHHPVKRYSHPPQDFQQWAEVCLGIAKHYNEGWAGGFQDLVDRWEIWNEPDTHTGPNSPCWTGTLEEYYELYAITAKTLKTHNASWRVGGPAAASVEGRLCEGFLRHCTQSGAPLDFFSWHTYANSPQEILRLARIVRNALDENGFQTTVSILNEWHYGPNGEWEVLWGSPDTLRRHAKAEEMNGPAAASYTAAALLGMQNGPVDLANYYTADNLIYFGLFDHLGTPLPPYSAFLSFAALAQCQTQVAVTRNALPETIYAAAARQGDDEIRLMVVNDSAKPASLRVAAEAQAARWTTEHSTYWADVSGDILTLPARAFVCLAKKLH